MSSVVSDTTMSTSPMSSRSRRRSSAAEGVFSPKELQEVGVEIVPNPNIKKLKWRICESPAKLAEADLDKADWMHEMLTTPPVNRIDLKFPQSLTLTVRKPKGVTCKDAMDVVYKKFKHKALEDIAEPQLDELEWDRNDYATLELLLRKV
ncbi:hypothetical protein BCR37DRAFT_381522 [Protomyces lactucae-debilis]|uniref:DUF6699 domain-containing protein n=1 Tax=Protomyces lactucae-debilis TaxID=2754530 RepID=A0A1Y2F647_PROLT|nr:uncharacterized protein BCR37DRAFT_381522 [Protomyces lactucae-debilis]ORY79380.1 hypothetical protein BCR37DRAFT_381522 [Protomyces lactucae-debilis]